MNTWLPIIAVDDDHVLVESSGAVYPRAQLSAIVLGSPSSLFVTHNAGIMVAGLDDDYRELPGWNFKAAPIEREVWKPNRGNRRIITNTVIGWFGFRGRIHYPLDPLIFCRKTAHDLIPEAQSTLEALLVWGTQIREWSLRQGIGFKTSQGSIGALMLRDSRFYPESRRKVPAATNEKARPKLPGNYYRLHTSPYIQHKAALYLDQISSHHNCAKDIEFPSANRLVAKGRFSNIEGQRLFAKAGTPFFDKHITRPGLFCLDVINKGKFADGEFPLPIQEKPGRQRVCVYSNELAYLRSLGTIIEGIVAAWTSDTVDVGLNKYAQWALAEIDRDPKLKPWLKPALLSTYGVLAATPKNLKIGFRHSTKGQPAMYPVGGGLLSVKEITAHGKKEPGITNVIHRGMIEAETRIRSLSMATQIHQQGFRVLGVYADSVFVAYPSGATLPMLPAGWRLEGVLTDLQFLNDVSFVSNEVAKLPGVTDAERAILARRHRKAQQRAA